MTDWPVHAQTQEHLKQYLKNPAQTLILTGQPGSGKGTLALEIAASLLGTDKEHIHGHPYFVSVRRAEDKQEISIDEIRKIGKFVQLRVPGKSSINRVAVVEDAQNLSLEAQNAFLKMLEEPVAGTVLILTADSIQSVLPTVASRAQKVSVLPVSLQTAAGHYAKSHSKDDINSSWLLSRGSASLMHALLTGDEEHPLKAAVGRAKDLLGLDTYERLVMLDKIARDKDNLKITLDALGRVISALQTSAIAKNNTGQGRKLLKARKLVDESLEALESNASPRLVIQNMVLNLSI